MAPGYASAKLAWLLLSASLAWRQEDLSLHQLDRTTTPCQAWVVEAVGETEAQLEGTRTRLPLRTFLCTLVVVRLRGLELPRERLQGPELRRDLSLQLTVGLGHLQVVRHHSSKQPALEVCHKLLLQHQLLRLRRELSVLKRPWV